MAIQSILKGGGGDTANNLLRDAAIQHAHALERYKETEIASILKMLNTEVYPRIVDELEQRLALIKERGYDRGVETTARLRALRDSLFAITKEGGERAKARITNSMDELSVVEAQIATKEIESVTVGLGLDLITPSPQVLRALVQERPLDGSVVSDYFDAFTASSQKRMQTALNTSLTTGESFDKLTARIAGTGGLDYEDGTLAADRRQIRVLAGSALQHAATVARSATYAENSDIVESEVWTATLDTLTCARCQALDGQEFPVGEGPMPPLHLGPCRCQRWPKIKGWEAMGIDPANIPPSTRSSLDGEVPDSTTYGDWITAQSAERQDEALGPERAALLRSGEVSFKDFSAKDGRPLTLKEIRAAHGIEEPQPSAAKQAEQEAAQADANAAKAAGADGATQPDAQAAAQAQADAEKRAEQAAQEAAAAKQAAEDAAVAQAAAEAEKARLEAEIARLEAQAQADAQAAAQEAAKAQAEAEAARVKAEAEAAAKIAELEAKVAAEKAAAEAEAKAAAEAQAAAEAEAKAAAEAQAAAEAKAAQEKALAEINKANYEAKIAAAEKAEAEKVAFWKAKFEAEEAAQAAKFAESQAAINAANAAKAAAEAESALLKLNPIATLEVEIDAAIVEQDKIAKGVSFYKDVLLKAQNDINKFAEGSLGYKDALYSLSTSSATLEDLIVARKGIANKLDSLLAAKNALKSGNIQLALDAASDAGSAAFNPKTAVVAATQDVVAAVVEPGNYAGTGSNSPFALKGKVFSGADAKGQGFKDAMQEWRDKVFAVPEQKLAVDNWLHLNYREVGALDAGRTLNFNGTEIPELYRKQAAIDRVNLYKALESAPVYEGKLLRGLALTNEQLAAYNVGDVIRSESVTSWTKSEKVATVFSRRRVKDGRTPTIFKVKNGQGVSIDELVTKHHDKEYEHLVVRGKEMRVVSKTFENGTWTIEMQFVNEKLGSDALAAKKAAAAAKRAATRASKLRSEGVSSPAAESLFKGKVYKKGDPEYIASQAAWTSSVHSKYDTKEAFRTWAASGYEKMSPIDAGRVSQWNGRPIGHTDTEHYKKKLELMYAELEHAPKIQGTLFRGTAIESAKLANLVPGSRFEMDAISSWSSSQKIASKFGHAHDNKVKVLFKSRNARAVSIQELRLTNEKEHLVPRKQQLEVVSIEVSDGYYSKKYTITVKFI